MALVAIRNALEASLRSGCPASQHSAAGGPLRRKGRPFRRSCRPLRHVSVRLATFRSIERPQPPDDVGHENAHSSRAHRRDRCIGHRRQHGRRCGEGRLSLQNGSFVVPLKAGDNEVAVALANNFYGWGLILRLENLDGITLAHK